MVRKKKKDEPTTASVHLITDAYAHKRITNLYSNIGLLWLVVIVGLSSVKYGWSGFFASFFLMVFLTMINHFVINKGKSALRVMTNG